MALGQIVPDGSAGFLRPVPVEPQERTGWFTNVLEKMRRQHLRRNGNYVRLRCLLPIPALALVWMGAMHSSIGWNFHALINSSITLRHLLLWAGAVLVWQLLSASRPKAATGLRTDLEAEAALLIRSSAGSALFVYFCGVGHLSHLRVCN